MKYDRKNWDNIFGCIPLMNIKYKFIIFAKPKCGNTNIKFWFFSLNNDTHKGILFSENDIDSKKFNAVFKKVTKNEKYINDLSNNIFDKKYKKIMIIRNPYYRILSLYFDKIIIPNDDLVNNSFIIDVLNKAYELLNKNKKKIFKKRLTINEFILYLSLEKHENYNVHFKKLSHGFDIIKPDKIIYLKNLSNDFINLEEELGIITKYKLDKKIRKTPINHNNINIDDVLNMNRKKWMEYFNKYKKFPNYDNILSKNIKEKIKKIYLEDFELFFKNMD